MFINQSFVAIIFKLINFFSIIGLALFIFKKYFKADILFAIAKKEIDCQNLLRQQTTLRDQQKELELIQQEEIIQHQNFKSKIDQWKIAVLADQQKQKEGHHTFLAITKKRNSEILLKKESQRLHNNIIDIVVSDLEKSISSEFKNPQKGADYLADIMSFMRKKTS